MLSNALLLALREIRRNLLRSCLTVLGIVIGVAAVITMVTLGNGATRAVADQISSLGSNLLIVRPGQRLGPGRDSAGAPAFRLADADAIRTQVAGIRAVAPAVGQAVTLVAGNGNWSSTVSGSTNDYFTAANWRLADGRLFGDEELAAGKTVCVIGNTVRRQLFGNRNPVGDSLRIKGFSCEIVGLLAAKGQGAMGIDQDDVVLMPLTTVQRRLTGKTDVTTILVSLRASADAWNASIEDWLYVSGTGLARSMDVDGYYARIIAGGGDVRVSDVEGGAETNIPTSLDREFAPDEVVSPDALALVRFGLRAVFLSPPLLRLARAVLALGALLPAPQGAL